VNKGCFGPSHTAQPLITNHDHDITVLLGLFVELYKSEQLLEMSMGSILKVSKLKARSWVSGRTSDHSDPHDRAVLATHFKD